MRVAYDSGPVGSTPHSTLAASMMERPADIRSRESLNSSRGSSRMMSISTLHNLIARKQQDERRARVEIVNAREPEITRREVELNIREL